MGTTAKALKLLDLFSASRPEIGLSDFARLAGRDKATTHRHLAELAELGFVEQARRSKLYRLGPAVLRLANIREQTFPQKRAAARYIADLVEAVQETVHVTSLLRQVLTPIQNQHSLHHTTRVYIDPSEVLPLHATASGCAVMAFSPPVLLAKVLETPLPSKTSETTIDPVAVQQKVAAAAKAGFAYSVGEFEIGVSSIAAPLFGENDECAGAIAVVCPTVRMTDALDLKIRTNLAKAAHSISLSWGGRVPAALVAIWDAQFES